MKIFPKNEKNEKESGQVFIEFILLLAILVTLSYGLLAGLNGAIGERWRGLVYIVTKVEGSDLPELN